MYCNKWVGNAFSENGQKNVRIKESLLREWNRMRKRLVEWIKEKLVVGSAIKHTYIPSYPSISIWNELKISWPFFLNVQFQNWTREEEEEEERTQIAEQQAEHQPETTPN